MHLFVDCQDSLKDFSQKVIAMPKPKGGPTEQVSFRAPVGKKWKWRQEAARREMNDKEFYLAAVELYASIPDDATLEKIQSLIGRQADVKNISSSDSRTRRRTGTG